MGEILFSSSQKNKPIIAHIDNFIFVKKGYSIISHLLPFTVASLLLIVITVPGDNLFLKIIQNLQISVIWIPAFLLTVVCIGFYFFSMRAKIQQVYFFQNRLIIRTICTTLLFQFLCASMAYLVLRSTSPVGFFWTDIWGCVLISSLSLTGIGWGIPSNWTELINLRMPDYKNSHKTCKQLQELLAKIRNSSETSKENFSLFKEYVHKLRIEIDENLSLEPAWSRSELSIISSHLNQFEEIIEQSFEENFDSTKLLEFNDACRGNRYYQYGEFINSLHTLEKLSQFSPN